MPEPHFTEGSPFDTSRAIEVAQLALQRGEFVLQVPQWSLPRGAIAALVGANGAGKTTFLAAMAGKIQADEGRITTFGVDADSLGYRRPEVVALVPDRFEGFEDYSARSHLRFLADMFPRWDAAYSEDLADRLKVPLDKPVKTLSHGAKAKLGFIAHEAMRPPVLLLDEPTSSLDPEVRADLLDVLQQIATQAGSRSIVLSTHLLEDVATIASHISLVRRGEVFELLGPDRVTDWRLLAPGDRYSNLAGLFDVDSFS